MSKWQVKITSKAEIELGLLVKSGQISKFDIKVLLRWLDEMEEFGPDYISKSKNWHDHELQREWFGFRSSAFSSSGRVIYRIIHNKIIVEVYKVTANHDYKK